MRGALQCHAARCTLHGADTAGTRSALVRQHQAGVAIEIGERDRATGLVVLVFEAIAVVVEPVAHVQRDGAVGRALERGPIGSTLHDAAVALAGAAAVCEHESGHAGRVGERDTAPGLEVLVGDAVAVVVEPIADVERDRAVRRALQRDSVGRTLDDATAALASTARIRQHQILGAVSVGERHATAGLEVLVLDPVAVVVEPVTDIRDQHIVGVALEPGAAGGADDLAPRAHAHAAVAADEQLRRAVGVGELERAALDEVVVGDTIAVVVVAVAEIDVGEEVAVALQLGPIRAADHGAAGALAGPALVGLHEPRGAVEVSERDGPPRDEVLVCGSVAVVVERVAQVGRRRTVGGALQLGPIRGADDVSAPALACAAAVALHETCRPVEVGECHGAACDEVLVGRAVAVVVERIAQVWRLAVMAVARQRGLVGAAHDRAPGALADAAGVALHEAGVAVQIGQLHCTAVGVLLVGRAIAVVVQSVADVLSRLVVAGAQEGQSVVCADHAAAIALAHAAGIRQHQAAVAVQVRQRDDTARLVVLVGRAVAVVVEPVADVLGGVGQGGAGERRVVRGALHLAVGALADTARVEERQARAAVRVGVADRAARLVVLVGGAIAVVVEAVTDVLVRHGQGGAGQRRLVRAAEHDAVDALTDAAGLVEGQPLDAAQIGVGDGAAGLVVLVGGAVAVVVEPVADVLGRGEEGGACQRRLVGMTHDLATVALPDATRVAEAEARRAPGIGVADRAAGLEVLVDQTVAVVVDAVADLSGLQRMAGARQRRKPRPADDVSARAGTDTTRVALLEALGAVEVDHLGVAVGPEVLVGQAVAVVVEIVTQIGGRELLRRLDALDGPAEPAAVGAHQLALGALADVAAARQRLVGTRVTGVGVAVVDEAVAVVVDGVAQLDGARMHVVVAVVAVGGRTPPVAVLVDDAVAGEVTRDAVLVDAVAAPLGSGRVHQGILVVAVVGGRRSIAILVEVGAGQDLAIAVLVADLGRSAREAAGLDVGLVAREDGRVRRLAVALVGAEAVAVQIALIAALVGDAVAVLVDPVAAAVGATVLTGRLEVADAGGLGGCDALHETTATGAEAAGLADLRGAHDVEERVALVGLAVAVVVEVVAQLRLARPHRVVALGARVGPAHLDLLAVGQPVLVGVDTDDILAVAVVVDDVVTGLALRLVRPRVGGRVVWLTVAQGGPVGTTAAVDGAVEEPITVGVAVGRDGHKMHVEDAALRQIDGPLPCRLHGTVEEAADAEGDDAVAERAAAIGDLDHHRVGDRVLQRVELHVERRVLEVRGHRRSVLEEQDAQEVQLVAAARCVRRDAEHQRLRGGIVGAAGQRQDQGQQECPQCVRPQHFESSWNS